MQLPLRDMLCTTPASSSLPAPSGLLVLPAHVRVQDRRWRPRASWTRSLVEQLVLLGHVRVQRRGPGDDLLAAEVVDRREVGLAPGLLELGDVGAHLLPRPVGAEVAADDVLEGLADLAPVGVVPVVVGLAADPAADAHLAHHLQHGLVGYAHALLGSQAHGDLPVAAAVGGAREDLAGGLPELGPGGSLGVRQSRNSSSTWPSRRIPAGQRVGTALKARSRQPLSLGSRSASRLQGYRFFSVSLGLELPDPPLELLLARRPLGGEPDLRPPLGLRPERLRTFLPVGLQPFLERARSRLSRTSAMASGLVIALVYDRSDGGHLCLERVSSCLLRAHQS